MLYPGHQAAMDSSARPCISWGKRLTPGLPLNRESNGPEHGGVSAMNNIHAPRETFRRRGQVMCVSIVIKEGGGLVNVVPERVTMEIMVRAFSLLTLWRMPPIR